MSYLGRITINIINCTQEIAVEVYPNCTNVSVGGEKFFFIANREIGFVKPKIAISRPVSVALSLAVPLTDFRLSSPLSLRDYKNIIGDYLKWAPSFKFTLSYNKKGKTKW